MKSNNHHNLHFPIALWFLTFAQSVISLIRVAIFYHLNERHNTTQYYFAESPSREYPSVGRKLEDFEPFSWKLKARKLLRSSFAEMVNWGSGYFLIAQVHLARKGQIGFLSLTSAVNYVGGGRAVCYFSEGISDFRNVFLISRETEAKSFFRYKKSYGFLCQVRHLEAWLFHLYTCS